MQNLMQDLRYALRGLMKRPAFSAAVIITLALGIGANTAIFTVVDAALLRGLPYRDSDRIVHLWENVTRETASQREASSPDFVDWKTNNQTFDSIAGYGQAGLILNGPDSSEVMNGGRVTADFFRVLGVQSTLGRTLATGDDEPGAPRVVVLSHGAWQRRFGSDPDLIGKSITLSGSPYAVVGVLPASFQFAPLGDAELFVPMNPSAEIRGRRFMHFMRVIGRLKDGVTFSQAQLDMNSVAAQISQQDPRFHANTELRLVNLRDQIVGNVKLILLVLLVAVTFVLLISCANVANLFLVRSAARNKEMAVRVALGASRVQLAKQLFLESLVLSVIGGGLAILIARTGVAVLVRSIPLDQLSHMPYLTETGLNGKVLIYTLGISMLAGLVFTVVPLFHVGKTGLQSTLKEGGRNSGGSVPQRLRSALVVVEIALTVMLAIGVGLMLKSTVRLLSVNPGFDSRNLLTMRIPLVGLNYAEGSQRLSFQRELLNRLTSTPGIKSAATTGKLSLDGGGDTGTPIIDGHNGEPNVKAESSLRTVSSSYFETMGIPLVKGRTFSEHDAIDAPRSIVVNQTFVKTYFEDRDPIAHRVGFVFDSSGKPWNIVGVVGDENVRMLDAVITPVIYFPYSQDPEQTINLVLRTTSDPLSLSGEVRETIRRLDRTLPVFAITSMSQMIEDSPSTFTRRYPAFLIGIFAGIAMLLAAVGLYGVVSYSVSQRTHELGVRIALGAQRRDIFRLVLGQGLLVTIIGVAIGLVAALVLTRFLSSLLFEVSPYDPTIIMAVTALMIVVSIAASFFPTLRAATVDPQEALRYE